MPLAARLAQARAYLAKVEPAVEGRGGDPQTFRAACLLVIDFDLKPGQALPLLTEWNSRCEPPWDEKDLARKLDEADKKPGVRGKLLHKVKHKGKTPRVSSHDLPAPDPATEPFYCAVPDFVQWDVAWALPQLAKAKNSNGRGLKRPILPTPCGVPQEKWTQS